MKIIFHKNFERNYKKLPKNIKERFKDRRDIFLENSFDPILNNHTLTGKYFGYRSIDVTGDIRVIFEQTEKEIARFVNIGTHSQLYG